MLQIQADVVSGVDYVGFSDDVMLKSLKQANTHSGEAQPYIININNTKGVDVPNFVIFNGNDVGAAIFNIVNPNKGGYSNGDYRKSGVIVSSGINGVTFQQLVNQSQTNPFIVGTTVITSNNGVNAQVQQPFIASTTDASGLTQGVPVPLRKDPYQIQQDMIVCNTKYQIDGTAALTISNVLARANFDIYFYPSDYVNPTNKLEDKSLVVKMPEPKVIMAVGNSVLMTSEGKW